MTNNNTIKLILCVSLMYGATAWCASAEEMHIMADAQALLEETNTIFDDIRYKALQQKDFLVNIIANHNQMEQAIDLAANAEFIRANNVLRQAALEKEKNAALMLLETINQGEVQLASLEKKMFQLQEAGNVNHSIYAELAKERDYAKRQLAEGKKFVQIKLAEQAQEIAEIDALQAGVRQALEAAQQAPNQLVGAMRQEVEMHQAAAAAGAADADPIRQEEPAGEVDQIREAAPARGDVGQDPQAAADRWRDIREAANVEIQLVNNLREVNALMNAARNGDMHKVTEWLKQDLQERAKMQNDAILPAHIIRNGIEMRELTKTVFLFEACAHQQLNVINFLLGAGAKINYQADREVQIIRMGDTCLIAAARAGHINVAQLLIQAGADKAVQNYVDDTALIAASEKGHDTIVEMLLQDGANEIGINMKNIDGNTALHLATITGHDTIATMLIQTNVDIDIEAQNRWGRTPLILAAKYNHPEIVKILLDAGADKQAVDNDGYTALRYAQEHGNQRMLNLFTRK